MCPVGILSYLPSPFFLVIYTVIVYHVRKTFLYFCSLFWYKCQLHLWLLLTDLSKQLVYLVQDPEYKAKSLFLPSELSKTSSRRSGYDF